MFMKYPIAKHLELLPLLYIHSFPASSFPWFYSISIYMGMLHSFCNIRTSKQHFLTLLRVTDSESWLLVPAQPVVFHGGAATLIIHSISYIIAVIAVLGGIHHLINLTFSDSSSSWNFYYDYTLCYYYTGKREIFPFLVDKPALNSASLNLLLPSRIVSAVVNFSISHMWFPCLCGIHVQVDICWCCATVFISSPINWIATVPPFRTFIKLTPRSCRPNVSGGNMATIL